MYHNMCTLSHRRPFNPSSRFSRVVLCRRLLDRYSSVYYHIAASPAGWHRLRHRAYIYISRCRINLRTRWLIIGFVDVRIMRLPERGVASTPTHVTCWTTYHDLSYIHANQRQICMTRSVRTRPVCAIVDEVRAWNWVDVQGRFRGERIAVVISARCALERHLAVEDIKRKVRKIYDSMRSRYISHFDRRVKIKRHPLAESY